MRPERPSRGSPVALALIAALVLSGCMTIEIESTTESPRPYVLVLGTAQDGGFPQIGSEHERARSAWENPEERRLVASLLIADERSGKRWLIDATPDLPEQVERAREHPRTRHFEGDGRPPLFEGIFLTHAHMGHYTGLVHLGREAYGAKQVPVHATASMCWFLRKNGPWSQLVELENIVLHELTPGAPVALADDLSVTPFLVPHRAEYTDTVGFRIDGPERSMVYIPDIDKWHLWDQPIEEVIASVDHALVDGTFYADGEIPGRPMASIPHPFIEESMTRLQGLPEAERAKVIFTHLNQSNPATDPEGEAQREIQAAGFQVAEEGQVIRL